ncbi:MAG: YggS family pyridoxal phosphate-dependent enzyme [Candidatus Cloacimonetes bacterium]|nr:YggS family pyridoxal phosphate-dependent enzyme [Candidatus Cloacimonadota bacterium]
MIVENIESIKKKIASAARKAGRNPDDIIMLAVTKRQSIDKIEEAVNSGIDYIGENQFQEAYVKIPLIRDKIKEFHFIGHLQTNKISKLIPLGPALIHSVDSYHLALKLDEYLEKKELTQNILIQVNTSGEKSKFGVEPDDAEDLIRKIDKLESLRIKGLMTIGMLTNDWEKIRTCFRILRQFKENVKIPALERTDLKYLSMGMSNDFEIAIEEGANIIRIGTAIFGERY